MNEVIASDSDLLDELAKETSKCYNLKIMHLNVWGLLSMYNKLLSMLHELEEKNCAPDIIFVCETFLVDMKAPLCEYKEYNIGFPNKQSHKNGAIAILIHKVLVILLDLICRFLGIFKSCLTDLECKNAHNLIAGSNYSVPGTIDKAFITLHDDSINKIRLEKKQILIGTNQNFDFLDYRDTMKFLDVNLSSKLIPAIIWPTWITKDSATLIDNIYLSEELAKHHQLYILLNNISDHFPCILLLSKVYKKKESTNL